MIVWIFPAFRQFKSNLFYYFLLLALSDPVALLFLFLAKIETGITHSVVGILLFYSIEFNWKNLLENWKFNLMVLIVFVSAFFMLPEIILFVLICHLLILSKFMKYIIIRLHGLGEINCFYLVLVFYELTILVNLIVFISETNIGYVLHYITLSFELLIAIFFIIFKNDGRSLIISLKPAT